MKIKLLLFTLLSTFVLNAQTAEERDKMLQTYDLEKVNNYIDELEVGEAKLEQMLDEYVALNPEVRREYYEDGKHYVLYNILGNKPIYITTTNLKSAIATQTIALSPGGDLGLDLEGEGYTIGIWELDYPLESHQEFMNSDGTSRVSAIDTNNPNVGGGHASHVAGTLGASGVSGSAKGMAPKSYIVAGNVAGHKTETANEHLNSGMLVSNHSYGIVVDSDTESWFLGSYASFNYAGSTNDGARSWDQILYNSPYYTKVESAGNEGTFSYEGGLGPGLDKLTGSTVCKNNIVVANANVIVNIPPFGNPAITGAAIAPSSSQGPTDDGRIKPDITGRGTNVYSCDDSTDSSYGNSTGTSMSGPGVAGSLLLLQEHYNNLNSSFMRSSTLKGLVCHTATDDAENPNVSAIPYPGPDPFWGWGLLNAKFAAQTIIDAQTNAAIVEEKILNNGEIYSFTVNVSGSEKLMATICWTDLAGQLQNGILNSTTPALVNDLDIRITDSDNNEFLPWKLDLSNLPYAIKGDNIVDNIERVEVDLPTTGQYTITISHKGLIPGTTPGSVGIQEYSLIVTGSDLTTTLSNGENELSDFLVWPNPAKEMINYQFASQSNQTCLVKLIDLQGRVVYSQNVLGGSASVQGAINTSSYSKGVYFLSLNQGNQKTYKKVMLQ
ncbi:MAG: S8 family serine peptidase [Flavobacteriales bacterium]